MITQFQVKTAIVAGILDVGILATAIVVTQLALEGEARINAVGIMGAGLNIVMYGSPLAAMVSTTKITSYTFAIIHVWLVSFYYHYISTCSKTSTVLLSCRETAALLS